MVAPFNRAVRVACIHGRRGGGRRRGCRRRRAALALARRGVSVALLEAEPEPALAASGTNSGILHTGFDSIPGELETAADPARRPSCATRCSTRSACRCCAAGRSCGRATTRTRDAVARSPRTRERNGVEVALRERRRARGPGRSGHRPGRLHARAGGARPSGTAPSCGRGSRVDAMRRDGDGLRARERRRRPRTRARGRQLRRPSTPTRSRARRRRLVRDLSRARASSSCSTRRAASRSSGSCCRCPPSARRACSCFRRVDGKVIAGPDRGRPGGQGRLVGAAAGARRDPAEGGRDVPAARGRRADRRLRRAAAGRARRQLPDRAFARVRRRSSTSRRSAPPASPPRSGSPSTSAASWSELGVAARARARRSSRPRAAGRRVPWWRRAAEHRARHDACCSASTKAPRPSRRSSSTPICGRCARRGARSRSHHPRPGWVEQDPRGRPGRGRRRGRGAARRTRTGEVVACGLDHQGESVLAWDAESGEPLTPVVTWQDKRSQEVLDRLETRRRRRSEIRERSGLPLDPVLLGRQAGLAARARRRRSQRARDAGTLRMGTVDSFLCDRLGRGLRHRSRRPPRARSSRRPEAGLGPAAARDLRRAARRACPRSRDTAGDLGDAPPSRLGAGAAAARAGARISRRRSRAPGAWSRAG